MKVANHCTCDDCRNFQMRRTTNHHHKLETSKILLWLMVILFISQVMCGVVFAACALDTTIFQFTIPATGAIAGTVAAFYTNKAKMENIFKGKYKYMRMMASFKCKVSEEVFNDIEAEMEAIDNAYDNKIGNELSESVNQDIELQTI